MALGMIMGWASVGPVRTLKFLGLYIRPNSLSPALGPWGLVAGPRPIRNLKKRMKSFLA